MARRLAPIPLLALGLAGCADSAAETARPPTEGAVAVTTAPLGLEPLAAPLHGAGRVRAAAEATLSFPFGGVVDVRVARGARVRRGQVLAALDAAAADAQLAGARSGYEKAVRDAERAERLADTVTPVQRQDLATAVEVARAQVRAAEFQARRSVLVAPADGVVVDVAADPGETVGPGQPIVAFAGAGGFEVELVLPAAEALAAPPGTPAVAHLAALRRELSGVVTERSGGAGPLGGFTVVVALSGPTDGLAAGLVAAVDLAPAGLPVPAVPLRALAEVDGDDAAIYVVEGGRARRTPVRLAFVTDDRAALAEAPPLGAAVVVAGVPFLTDGARVAVGEE